MADLLQKTRAGLYCPAGDFHIDPLRPVARAVTTHAHSDHCRPGMGQYWCADTGTALLQRRVGADARITGVPHRAPFVLGDVQISFHPAGHIRGASQVRISDGSQTWVVAGDFKRAPDPTCAPFEVVPCDVFVSEATFGLPIYRWQPGEIVASEILAWWRDCARRGKAAVVLAYSLGKAQRVLAELHRLDPSAGPVYLHGAMLDLTAAYRAAGVPMLPTAPVMQVTDKAAFREALVIAPPSAVGTAWAKRLGPFETGFASGWMRVRGNRRRRAMDRGFVLSDHADWPALVQTAKDTGARRIWVQYAPSDALVHHLRGLGIDASLVPRGERGERGEADG